MIFCLVFVGYTKFKLNLVYNSIGLTILICIKTFFYIIYWKDFYKARLYTIQPDNRYNYSIFYSPPTLKSVLTSFKTKGNVCQPSSPKKCPPSGSRR